MAKISYVKAWGLWSHFETVFDFSPGLTVVTGPNGSGKSTIIRIIKWLALGEPSGEEFIFTLYDEKTKEIIKQSNEGKAEVGLDDGVIITKTRRKGKTTYTISTIAEPFEKAEVPQEVKDALGIRKYSFGDFEAYLNFAFQMEAPFLLSESPSVGAKVLGKLAGTEAVDLAIGEVSKRTHKARDEKRTAEKDIERINGDLLQYQDLDDLKQQLQACEYLVAEIEKAAARKDSLKDLDYKLTTARDTIDRLEGELMALMIVPDLEVELQNIGKAQQRYDALLGLYNQLDGSLRTIEELTNQLALYEGLDVAAAIINDLEAKDRRLTAITSLSTLYRTYTQEVRVAEEFLQTVKDLDVAADRLAYAEKLTAKADKLRTLYGDHTTTDAQVNSLIKDLEGLSGLEETAAILTEAINRTEHLEALKQLQQAFILKDTIAKQAAREVTAAEAAATAAQEELRAAWDAAGEICPLCEQPVNKHSQVERAKC